MMNSHDAIVVRNLHKIYKSRKKPDVHAVRGISFRVERGCIFGLLGPNGAGKSTVIKILTTLTPLTTGEAFVNGFNCTTQPVETRRSLAVVLQQNATEQYLTVLGNLRTYARFHQIPRAEADRRITEVMDLFGLYDVRNTHAIDLSGGMRRRLQVAKAFLSGKPVVILDEATTGLDPVNRRATLDAIRAQASKGTTIVLTTHLLDEAEILCDHLVIINHGKIIAEGDVPSVKRLGIQAYTVSLSFRNRNDDAIKYLERRHPLQVKTTNSTVEVTLKESHEEILTLIKEMDRQFPITHFEVRTADLETVFIDLLSQDGRETRS